jgi:hypothetical protein
MPTPEDEPEVPETPDEAELQLAVELGELGLRSLDDALKRSADGRFRKVALVIVRALKLVEIRASDAYVNLCVRRLIQLVDDGVLDAKGNIRSPRRSEVRLRLH